jgi:hypothetical protein
MSTDTLPEYLRIGAVAIDPLLRRLVVQSPGAVAVASGWEKALDEVLGDLSERSQTMLAGALLATLAVVRKAGAELWQRQGKLDSNHPLVRMAERVVAWIERLGGQAWLDSIEAGQNGWQRFVGQAPAPRAKNEAAGGTSLLDLLAARAKRS